MSPRHVASDAANHSPIESTPDLIEQQVAITAAETPDRPLHTAPKHGTINPTNHPLTESTQNQVVQQVTNAAEPPATTLAINVEEERETSWNLTLHLPK